MMDFCGQLQAQSLTIPIKGSLPVILLSVVRYPYKLPGSEPIVLILQNESIHLKSVLRVGRHFRFGGFRKVRIDDDFGYEVKAYRSSANSTITPYESVHSASFQPSYDPVQFCDLANPSTATARFILSSTYFHISGTILHVGPYGWINLVNVHVSLTEHTFPGESNLDTCMVYFPHYFPTFSTDAVAKTPIVIYNLLPVYFHESKFEGFLSTIRTSSSLGECDTAKSIFRTPHSIFANCSQYCVWYARTLKWISTSCIPRNVLRLDNLQSPDAIILYILNCFEDIKESVQLLKLRGHSSLQEFCDVNYNSHYIGTTN